MPAVAIASAMSAIAASQPMNNSHANDCIILENGDKYCKEVDISGVALGFSILGFLLWVILIVCAMNVDEPRIVIFLFIAPIISMALYFIIWG